MWRNCGEGGYDRALPDGMETMGDWAKDCAPTGNSLAVELVDLHQSAVQVSPKLRKANHIWAKLGSNSLRMIAEVLMFQG
jgi:hypothetical protein